jgi:hypothetical protein
MILLDDDFQLIFSLYKTDNKLHFPSITSSILYKFYFHASYDVQVSCHYLIYLEDVQKNIRHFEFFRDSILWIKHDWCWDV